MKREIKLLIDTFDDTEMTYFMDHRNQYISEEIKEQLDSYLNNREFQRLPAEKCPRCTSNENSNETYGYCPVCEEPNKESSIGHAVASILGIVLTPFNG